MELLRADGGAAAIGAAKRRNVLAALAIDLNRVVSADRLMDIAWDGHPPPTARASLQGHIAQLRKDLGDGVELVTRSPGYLLLAPRALLDVTRFEDLVAAARDASDADAVELLRDALALRRGPALVDIEAEALRRDASDRLDESVVTAVHELARRLNRLGRAAEAIEELREAVAMRPLREPLVELLVLSLHQAGRQAEALDVFHDTRIRLADELGVAPGTGLQEAFHTVLRADGERPPARVPSQLPRENRGFVGRGAELAQLDAALDDDGPIRILTGPAGVGKTALALRWAHQVAADFEDGCLFVDLRGFDDADPVAPAQALSGFLRALGVPAARIPDDLDERAALYRSVLADRRLLVVLDNARSAAQVRPLLPGNSGCVVLVSSRSRLDDLAATEGAVRLSLPVLDRQAAVAVLRLLLGSERVAAEPAAAAELAELCDRLPLALRIAAARGASHPHFTIRSLTDIYSDERHRLTRLSLPDSGGSIRAALTTSYRRLDDASARLFRLLGEHPGAEVDYFAAAALAGTRLRDNQARLESLVAVNLLHVTGPGRYGRHDLVRLHSATLAAAEPAADRDAAITRLLDYYLHAAESGLRAVEGPARRPGQQAAHPLAELPDLPTAQAALNWFRTEEDNIQHALALATARGQHDRACQLGLYLDRFRRHLGGPGPRELGEALAQAFFPGHIWGNSVL